MQFQVPQFIEIEDKIIGPFTLKQFFYLAAAGGISFVLFFILQTWLWIIVTIPLGAIAAAFALVKVHGQPFSAVVRSALTYYLKPKLVLWRKEIPKQELAELPEETKVHSEKLKGLVESFNVRSQLKNLWQKLQTTKEAVPGREKPLKQTSEKQVWEIMEKPTGERKAAKRVDYR